MSFELILPFLRPIAHLIHDPDVSEIMVNGGAARLRRTRRRTVDRGARRPIDERNLRSPCKNIARALGDDISEEQPMLDARLPDGSRVAAVFPPCAVHGTTLTIRKFRRTSSRLEELVADRHGARARAAPVSLPTRSAGGENILISGGTGTGQDDAAQCPRRAAAGTAIASS